MSREKILCGKEDIFRVAIGMVDREGIEALSVRSIAKELGVSPMTIYNYVENLKDIKKRVQEKVVSAAHQEYNSKHVLSNVTDQIKDGKDIFGRNAQFVRCEIDDSFPQYIREHQEELDFLIMHEEKAVVKTARKVKVAIKSTGYNILVGIKRIGRKLLGR